MPERQLADVRAILNADIIDAAAEFERWVRALGLQRGLDASRTTRCAKLDRQRTPEERAAAVMEMQYLAILAKYRDMAIRHPGASEAELDAL